MKNALTILFFVASLTLFPTYLCAGQFKVTRVYEGDAVGVGSRGIELKVKLVGIVAPQTSKNKRDPGHPYGLQAKRHLTDLVLNQKVSLKRYGNDGYNRILGVIHLGTKNINLEMIKAGLAKASREKPPRGLDLRQYLEAEKKARDAKLGMWSQGKKNVSPKDGQKVYK